MTGIARRITLACLTLTATMLVALGLTGLWETASDVRPAQATHILEIGIDADPTDTPANTATSLGTIEDCIEVSSLQQFDIYVYIVDVIDLLSWEAYMTFDSTVVSVVSVNVLMFQDSQPNSNVTNTSGPAGADPNRYRFGAAEQGVATNDDGDGVLARVTMSALAAGVSPLNITSIDTDGDGSYDIGPFIKDNSGTLLGDSLPPPNGDGFFDGPIANATVAVDQADACSKDQDGDGVIDTQDNCPSDANPTQDDFDGDGEGDVCDRDDDWDGFPDSREAYRGSDPMDPNSTPEVCDGVDNDLNDGIDEGYDLLPLPSGNGTADCLEGVDTDGDTILNPTDDDDDNDGWSDILEIRMRTDTLDACPDDQFDDAWWADPTNNGKVNINDVTRFRLPFLTTEGEPSFEYRMDFTGNGFININDVSKFRPVFTDTCTN